MDLGEGARNLFTVGQFLKPISKICRETGCAVLIVHHCKRDKLDSFQPATLADIAWSGFAEFSAQWILLSRRWRYDPQSGRHDLWLSCGGRSGHSSVWALDVDEGAAHIEKGTAEKVTGDDQGGREEESSERGSREPAGPKDAARQWKTVVQPPAWARERAVERAQTDSEERYEKRMSAQMRRDRARVIKVLERYPMGETARHLRHVLGMNGVRVERTLTSLVDSGDVEPTDTMEGRRGTRGWRLVNSIESVDGVIVTRGPLYASHNGESSVSQ